MRLNRSDAPDPGWDISLHEFPIAPRYRSKPDFIQYNALMKTHPSTTSTKSVSTKPVGTNPLGFHKDTQRLITTPRLILAAAIATMLITPIAAFAAGSEFVPPGNLNPSTITIPSNTKRQLVPNPLITINGLITSTGSLNVNSTDHAILITGTVALVIQAPTVAGGGTVQQLANTSNARAIRCTTNSSTGTPFGISITNSGLIKTVSQDAIQVTTASMSSSTSIFLGNYGTIVAGGGQALDWRDIKSAPNCLVNYGSITAAMSDAVRLGLDSGVFEDGKVENYGSIEGTNGNGINGGDATLNDTYIHHFICNTGTIKGKKGNGIDIDGLRINYTTKIVNTKTGNTGGLISGYAMMGDADGVDVDGIIDLSNTGDITGQGNAMMHEGVATGGGFIHNEGFIYGDTNGIKVDGGSSNSALAPITIENCGYIQGRDGYGILLIGSFNDLVSVSSTITGLARIDGNVDLGGGDDNLYIEGSNGNIIINGTVDGGAGADTVTFNVPTGQTYTFTFPIANLENLVKQGGGNLILTAGHTTWNSLSIEDGTVTLQ